MRTNLRVSLADLFVVGLLHFYFFLPGLVFAFLFSDLLRIRLGDPFQLGYWFKVLGMAYCWMCFSFFLKGWIICKRARGRLFRVGVGVYLLLCFLLPVIFLKMFIAMLFGIDPRHWLSTGNIGCWMGAVLVGWVAFRRYGITCDTAPFIVNWAYRLGRKRN